MTSAALGMVFAAGLGTRLRPLTERLPKPVVPLMNRPLASFSLERLADAGVTRCAVNTHHLADEVPRALAGFLPDGMDVRFVHEPTLLGTGGGLRNGLRRLLESESVASDTPILVMNGDIFFWPDLEGAVALHRRLDAVATVVLRPDPRARVLGALEVDADGRVRRLLGRPEVVDAPLREMMFTGVHVLSPRALTGLPEEGCVIQRAYRRWIDERQVVGGFVDDSAWRDLGTPAEYLRAHLELLDGTLRWPGVEVPADGVVCGPGAKVGEGARLDRVVLGPQARVAPGVQLERTVVWAGAEVSTSARDAVIAPHARVAVD